ncbi:hypothetical protein [Rheinheimera sp. 4Y26]|uniref:hypothetical protein n=1 Tax=Rheinheimera sp. 4Y26 TaxID=2977811 RepID=UPI0021B14FB1|nr:hypothetical protein [Rheinheimera sp. 4Y26]MCT6701177.1 hypothetical protein [Rheinheimera sp. 4Y26]
MLKPYAALRSSVATGHLMPSPQTTGKTKDKISVATGRSLQSWFEFLTTHQATTLSHTDIAALLKTQPGVSDWWAQQLTVKFEQHLGKRLPGQDCSGQFKLSVNKTLPGGLDEALALWLAAVAGIQSFNQVPLKAQPRVSQTEKWRYWRCELADGSRLALHIQQKTTDKVALSLQHEQLSTAEALEHWRSFWKAELPLLLNRSGS